MYTSVHMCHLNVKELPRVRGHHGYRITMLSLHQHDAPHGQPTPTFCSNCRTSGGIFLQKRNIPKKQARVWPSILLKFASEICKRQCLKVTVTHESGEKQDCQCPAWMYKTEFQLGRQAVLLRKHADWLGRTQDS